MSIANNIKSLRESRQMTQAEFGKIAGVSDKAVSTWENGSAEPRMGAIQRIADYFGISVCSVIGDDDQADILFIEKYGKRSYDVAMRMILLDDEDLGRVAERIEILLESDKYKKGLFEKKAI